MYENIAKVRQQQIAWAEQAAKHMLTLDAQKLELEGLPEEFAAFRAALSSEHGPLIVSAGMDCLASACFNALLQSSDPAESFVLINPLSEWRSEVCYFHFTAMLDAHVSFDEHSLSSEFKARFDRGGELALCNALAHALLESPPPTWGIIEFKHFANERKTLKANLVPAMGESEEG